MSSGSTSSTDRERRIRQRLKDDFPHYASRCIKIRTKAGAIKTLALNGDQMRLHEALERQRAETGKVRALVLKGRQMGVSTYVAARFYWRVTHGRGLRAFIQTHRDEATNNLFEMVKRMHDNCPPLIRPQTRASNAKELSFGVLDGGYRVGTAKAAGVGRSDTIQFLHGSEVAFWANAEDHAAGLLQAVADQPGTEVLLESTANGLGGLFYAMWIEAEAGRGPYLAIFLPWFDHDAYRVDPPADWQPEGEWVEYADLHHLDRDQIFWAYRKNAELGRATNDPADKICWRFRQEYPATAEEAFQVAGDRSFISGPLVIEARKTKQIGPVHKAPLIFGVDLAGSGSDETVVIDRQGRLAGGVVYERWSIADQMEIAGNLARLIDQFRPDRVFIDVGGGYSGPYDRLRELGYDVAMPVQFGGKPLNIRDYANKRAEIWGLMRDWLAQPGGVVVPDDEVLARSFVAPGYKFNSNRQLVLESKDDIRDRLGFSPDPADALACTFALPVIAAAGGIAAKPHQADTDYDPYANL